MSTLPPCVGNSLSKTLLLLDDHPAVVKLNAEFCKRLGYRVITTTHPAEALNVAGTYGAGIDLLVSDVDMPFMKGPDVVRKIRQIFPKLPILFVSGSPTDDLHRIDLLGAPLLEKPYTVAAFTRVIQGLLYRLEIP